MPSIDIGLGNAIKRPFETVLKKGDCIIIACWSWHKFGYKRSMVCLDEDGNVTVKDL